MLHRISGKIIFVVFMLIVSVLCFGESGDPPFPREVYLEYKGAKLIVGYTTIADVASVLGQPDNSTTSAHGGEGFYWNNLLMNTYFNGKLTLVFSIDKDRLIQVGLKPSKEDRYTTFVVIDETNNRTDILALLNSKRYNIDITPKGTIWLDYFVRKEPYLGVFCGFQFNDDQTLYALNYQIDSVW
ncbi:hypothetical protein FACS1894141_1130 [Spirochaetia bacterium]|nr:hypothetical protein FACS1894141_1130 [Spirochaetia bacterium]